MAAPAALNHEIHESTPLIASKRDNEGPSVTFLAPEVPRSSAKESQASDVSSKLGTFDGVFVPTTLNVLSILMFLRFGFIIGQAGFLGSMALLIVSYAINLLTTLSISAIATNGTVRGGGAYYMISRSLGPEFGGSIGIIFYVGQVLNAGLNVVGFVDPLLANFGEQGKVVKSLPEGPWWSFAYETVLLLTCTTVCFVGPSMFARSSKVLFLILILATISVPLSSLIMPAFYSEEFGAWYTGISWETFKSNLLPQFSRGAAGSDSDEMETFRTLFGIFFPATAGILAGASMSGDLKNPSRSIPRGTLYGIAVTILLYGSVILSVSASTSRELLYRDVNFIEGINVSPILVMLGEFATSIFSALMGILGAAKLLQAVAKDQILPFMTVFAHGVGDDDNPIAAIAFTYILTQVTILLDVNQIAMYITMAFLMTFVVTNVACSLLDVASAPNFRPSFRYFNATTATLGTISSILAMVCADGWAASSMVLCGLLIFIIIHLFSPPKAWGDVSQALIYHQVRKYLLKLRQDHVKYWRPQILLLVDDPRTCFNLLQFCNSLKKGGLFILGHVIIANDFSEEFVEVAKQRSAWTKLRDSLGIKAFVQISASSDVVWGARNVYLGSGLGGMRPNIVVIGFYDEHQTNSLAPPEPEAVDMEALPTDNCRQETHLSCQQWVRILEDMLTMGTDIAIAKGFMDMELPEKVPLFKLRPPKVRLRKSRQSHELKYIDLYPIQMSANVVDHEAGTKVISINFDTYTLILQLGAILHTVKGWHKTHELRVVAFVEHEHEKDRESKRISELLNILRIPATVLVYNLDKDNYAYDVIVKGSEDTTGEITRLFANSKWWQRLCKARKNPHSSKGKAIGDILNAKTSNTNQQSRYVVPGQELLMKRRRTLSSLEQMGIAHSIQPATAWNFANLRTFYNDSESDADTDMFSDNEEEYPADFDTSDANLNVESEEIGPTFSDNPITLEELAREDIAAQDDDFSVDPTPVPGPVASSSYQPSSRSSSPMITAAVNHELKFNELSAKAQHIILNNLMRNTSKEATAIFSTLPPPAVGTHASDKSAKDYLELIKVFCDNLPPIMLIHSQSMTVTTAL